MKLFRMTFHVIGSFLENELNNTDCDTARCPHKCLRRAVPLCQMPQMELNHLEHTCPLRSPRKDLLNRLFRRIQRLRIIMTLALGYENNDGYIKVTAVMQKFFDQAISGNWSYNPENYPDNEVPVSEMAKDLLNTYKYGWKTSYYQNTYDNKKDGDDEEVKTNVDQFNRTNYLTRRKKIVTVARSEVKGMTVFNKNKVDTKKQPMFFGQPLGVQRYDSYKYPVFDKLTQQQLGYFWRPEEVSLQKDRSDYQTLSDQQKHIFTSNLKYQIMLDSVQGRGPGMAFIPYCSLPELEACMTVWEFMEMIHSRSYTYIIKNVYSDPGEVFDTILG